MKTPFIVALAGLAGAGKDTAAKLLAEALQARGRRVAVLAFADPLGDMLAGLGVPWQYMHDRSLKEQPVPGFGTSYRHLAQTLGTEWGRSIDPEFWTQQLERRLSAMADGGRTPDFALITDARFPNEAAWVKAQGGLLVAVTRPGTEPVRAHESEQHALHPDHELRNDADLSNLRSRCGAFSLVLLAERALEA